MKIDTTYVIAFRSKGRLFVEIPEDIERKASIVAGEPLKLELVGENIIYHKMPGVTRLHQWHERRASDHIGKRHLFTSAARYDDAYSKEY